MEAMLDYIVYFAERVGYWGYGNSLQEFSGSHHENGRPLAGTRLTADGPSCELRRFAEGL